MQILPIDVTAVIAVIMGISIILIPVAGLTARYALKPMVEALSQLFATKGQEETVKILERRVAFLEQQVESMEHSLHRIEEVADFHQRLESGGGPRGAGESDRG